MNPYNNKLEGASGKNASSNSSSSLPQSKENMVEKKNSIRKDLWNSSTSRSIDLADYTLEDEVFNFFY